MSYDRLNWSHPVPEKDISKNAMYERLQSIYKLNLPTDITKQLVLLFKYDTLEKQYKKKYRKVLFELKKRFKNQRLSKRIDDTFPSHPVSAYEKQSASDVAYLDSLPCPSQKPPVILIS